MEDRETARMRRYGESKMTRIMMATVPHITSGLGLRKFQADGFLLTRMYMQYIMQKNGSLFNSVFRYQITNSKICCLNYAYVKYFQSGVPH